MKRALLLATLPLLAAACGGATASYTVSPSVNTVRGMLGPDASERDARAGSRIARASPLLGHVLGGTTYRLVRASPWDRADTQARLGVGLDLRLARPIDLDDDLPYVAIPPDAPAHGDCEYPYATGWRHIRSKRVARLEVLIDLTKGAVADVSPGGDSTIVFSDVSGKPHPSCQEYEGG